MVEGLAAEAEEAVGVGSIRALGMTASTMQPKPNELRVALRLTRDDLIAASRRERRFQPVRRRVDNGNTPAYIDTVLGHDPYSF
jgi:hypothetical protein